MHGGYHAAQWKPFHDLPRTGTGLDESKVRAFCLPEAATYLSRASSVAVVLRLLRLDPTEALAVMALKHK
jgi:hypothetical protein